MRRAWRRWTRCRHGKHDFLPETFPRQAWEVRGPHPDTYLCMDCGRREVRLLPPKDLLRDVKGRWGRPVGVDGDYYALPDQLLWEQEAEWLRKVGEKTDQPGC